MLRTTWHLHKHDFLACTPQGKTNPWVHRLCGTHTVPDVGLGRQYGRPSFALPCVGDLSRLSGRRAAASAQISVPHSGISRPTSAAMYSTVQLTVAAELDFRKTAVLPKPVSVTYSTLHATKDAFVAVDNLVTY